MNKSALKAFAVSARKELLKKVEAKAMKIGITEDSIKKADIESSDAIFIDGKHLSKEEKVQRDKLITRINQIGFQQVMEEVAYTWFNRFTALRYMEVNEYLPSDVRVLSSTNKSSTDPDIINQALELDLDIDKEYVYELKLDNKTEELFKYLIIKHCNDLNKYLPFMFKTIDDYTEILYPEGVLAKDSFIRQMTDLEFIPEMNWKKVEVIGWLYQYYIAEEKDRVFKEKKKFKAEEIPFATQLFTPDWIVRYMVQNSLGRYWIESHPEHRALLDDWELYLENSTFEGDFEESLTPYINKELRVEDIKCFDPAMGSGHILIYMFDVLYEIYSKCGYMEREIPRLIIENNLYGLDIDDRAYQLACFSVVMKALEYNSRFFRSIEREGLKLNLSSIQETNSFNEEDVIFLTGEGSEEYFDLTKKFIEVFNNAKTFGSLIKLDEYPKEFLEKQLKYIRANPANNLFEEEVRNKVLDLLPKLLKQAEIMCMHYDILVTNPPYMGSKYMNEDLSKYLKKNYPDSKTDIFASFMEINHYLKRYGFFAMINQHSWMFLPRYENLRRKIISNYNLYSMLHLGTRAFEEIGGEVVQTTSFVLRNSPQEDIEGSYVRLVDFKDSKLKEEKAKEAITNPEIQYRYSTKSEEFIKIPGQPIAYWLTDTIKDIFSEGIELSQLGKPREGLHTGNTAKYTRMWYEIDYNKFSTVEDSYESIDYHQKKWIPYNKGGGYRKWYGNKEFVICFDEESRNEMAKLKSHVRPSQELYFKRGMTWSLISSSNFGVRCFEKGMIFDVSSHSFFCEDKMYFFFAGLLNSKVIQNLLLVLNPTMNFSSGVIGKIPIVNNYNDSQLQRINQLVEENISISKEEWNSFEVSWDFRKHPFITRLKSNYYLEEVYNSFNEYWQEKFMKLKSNEEELNKIFIEIYGLQHEMSPEIEEKDVTLRKPDKQREVKSFISYAVGCMLGRYSLDYDGIIPTENIADLKGEQVFKISRDNILPILSGAYFEDDIVARFIEFLQVTFGEETLVENLEFIAESLGKKKGETAKETIRRYFINNFFKDHAQTYKKRPIYWLFTSGKEKAFNCLIYMHRYDKTTLSRIRTDYLHEYQIRLDAEKKNLMNIIEGDYSTKEISNAKKQLKSLDKNIEELKDYDELLHHMADMQIDIDLNNGVEANYEKFKELVAKK
ncbi:BREX-1 system adenine-specific DNA-methyltransferase PglX [Priestia megaterium]|uniref:BREX-1 system adenine-specific DNA-methyltransferase PglX n=1 Tax=Priestia megaterium TaxID=1404 RepID=UPI002E1E0DEB|nr:BREX-1 system adenine-specific DNA-methyltransferase PglX [Priestia megaterium]MED4238943.1 BREX-1 system adenine-specific DNA-methyltransferase PglX [Priestia megaterium]